jgi:Zn-dependent protease with chaperone function
LHQHSGLPDRKNIFNFQISATRQGVDFFDRQERARRQTRMLIGLFGLAVLAVVAILYLILAAIIYACRHPLISQAWWDPIQFLITAFFLFGEALLHPVHFLKLIWNPHTAGWIALGTLTSIALGCLYKIRRLSGGGPAVMELLGGRRVEPGTTDPAERRLRNVVEEMAIASGLPVPEIYVLDRERGINAFAAGHHHDDVAIGVTFGGLKLLSRDELQGVIAHEFSHVLNGDTRLNMKLMGLAHGLFWPTIVGRVLLRGTSAAPETDESIFEEQVDPINGPLVPVACIFLMLGSIGAPLVRGIKSLICRERELLADAAAVQFTRNPPGLEGALKKIGGLPKQGRLDSPHAETASHLYFANSSPDPWFGFQATHPLLAKRVRVLDPAFDGKFPRIHSLPSPDAEYDRRYEESVRRARAEAAANPER